MGKKKDKRKAHEAGRGGAQPLAGLAATLVRQLDTPAGRQVIAAGLMAAAGAIAGKDARKAAPTPPAAPPAPDAPIPPRGPFAGETPEPPRSDAPALPPEVAKVIGSVAAGLERWAAGFGAKKPEGPAG